jgi:hypothetical protein
VADDEVDATTTTTTKRGKARLAPSKDAQKISPFLKTIVAMLFKSARSYYRRLNSEKRQIKIRSSPKPFKSYI